MQFESLIRPTDASAIDSDHPGAMTYRTHRGAWIAAVVVLAVVGGGLAYLLLRPSTFTLTGVVTLDSEWTNGPGKTCVGKMDHEDVREGAQVIVTDNTGAVVALGQLQPGTLVGVDCEFPIRVEGVPAGRGFYGMTLAGRQNPIRYTEADAAAGRVHLVLAQVP